MSYVGDSLPGYDAWKLASPPEPPEEPTLEYSVTYEVTLRMEVAEWEAQDRAHDIGRALEQLLARHIRELDYAEAIEEVWLKEVELS